MKMHTLAVCRERNVLSVGHNLLPVLILNAGDIYQVIELTKLVFFFLFFFYMVLPLIVSKTYISLNIVLILLIEAR